MKKSTVNQGLSRPPEHCRARKVIGWYDQWYGMIWLCRSIDQLILQFPYVPWRSMFAHNSPLRLPICHVRCHQFRQASWRWCRSSQAQAATQAVRSQGRTCSIYLCLQPLQLWSIQLFWDQTQLAQHLAERARACLEDFGWKQPSSLGMLRQQPWFWDGDQKIWKLDKNWLRPKRKG